jgi:hypothetical protein
VQDQELSLNQNLNRGRTVIVPREFRPGMPVVQMAGPRNLWNRAPRATFLGERGSLLGERGTRVMVIRSDPDGLYVAEERRAEVFAPAWALQEEREFQNAIPENMQFLDQDPEPDE